MFIFVCTLFQQVHDNAIALGTEKHATTLFLNLWLLIAAALRVQLVLKSNEKAATGLSSKCLENNYGSSQISSTICLWIKRNETLNIISLSVCSESMLSVGSVFYGQSEKQSRGINNDCKGEEGAACCHCWQQRQSLKLHLYAILQMAFGGMKGG